MKNWSAALQEFATYRTDGLYAVGSSGLLFRTGGVAWGIDPAVRVPPASPPADYSQITPFFPPLKFILLTHLHEDHYDPQLLAASHNALIIAPAEIAPQLYALGDRVIAIPYGDHLDLDGFRIHCFRGFHDSPGRTYPCGMFRVESPAGDFCFPADVRDIQQHRLPDLPPPDLLVLNVWLGYLAAENQDYPILEEVCRFFGRLAPKRILLSHLEESGRLDDSRWTLRHAKLLTDCYARLYPRIHCQTLLHGTWLDF